MLIKANGILRHRFWGEYSAVIGLVFDNSVYAQLALEKLGERWKVGKDPKNLTWMGNSEELDLVTKILVSFGAEEKKIASIAKSIDYGEPFAIVMEVDDPNQQKLF